MYNFTNNKSSKELNIPVPILFNCWKHHKNFIRGKISEYAKIGEESLDKLKEDILQIGKSQLDLYLGNLTPEEISNFTKNKLENKYLIEKEVYKNWISSSTKLYRMISLPDKSKWTLRLGNDEIRYVHIHPGRHVINSIRIRALTLKTAIFFSFFKQTHVSESDDQELINNLRKTFLNVPPLKSLAKSKGLIKVIELLNR